MVGGQVNVVGGQMRSREGELNKLRGQKSWRCLRMTRDWILPTAMAIAVIVNMVQFPGIEADTRHNYRAIYVYETDDLFQIAISRDGSARRWVAPFHYLGELFPGSTIIIPEEGIRSWFPFEESVLTFGKAAEIRRSSYDPIGLMDLASIQEYRIAERSFVPDVGRAIRIVGERVAYFADGTPSGTFLVMTPEGHPGRSNPIVFVDVDLLDDSAWQTLGLG